MAFVVLPGADASGNGNDWTANNINNTDTSSTTYDIMTDVPTLIDEDTANYATWNPLDHFSTNVDFSNANLKYTVPAGTYSNGGVATSTITMTSGKWYCEMTVLSAANMVGIAKLPRANMRFLGDDVTGYGYYTNGGKYNGSGLVSYGASFTTNDVIGVALDLDAGTLTFYKNGVSQGTAFTGLSGEFVFATGNAFQNTQITAVNFGQQPFAYTPPAGYLKLNTFNLPDSSIVDGSEYFNSVLYTGTGEIHNITGVGFQPDFTIVKSRSNVASHNVYDSVRGIKKILVTNNTPAEVTEPANAGLDSFDSDGFTIDAVENFADVNILGRTYVAWNWKAGGTAVSNTDGTITSTVSANPTSGFSVVTYTGTGANATVGHGLGVAPQMVIVKIRNNSYEWKVWQTTIPSNKHLVLNSTVGLNTDSSVFTTDGAVENSDTSVDFVSNGFKNRSTGVNVSSATYIYMAFAENPFKNSLAR
jgi:hypothetical protein